jgi:hypothetical protein
VGFQNAVIAMLVKELRSVRAGLPPTALPPRHAAQIASNVPPTPKNFGAPMATPKGKPGSTQPTGGAVPNSQRAATTALPTDAGAANAGFATSFALHPDDPLLQVVTSAPSVTTPMATSVMGPPGVTEEIEMLRDKVRRLEAALDARSEQLTSERGLHMLRHERAANVIVAERARSSTPNFGVHTIHSRPVSVLNDDAASRPLSRMLLNSYGGSTSVASASGQVAVPSLALGSTFASRGLPSRGSGSGGGGIALPPVVGLMGLSSAMPIPYHQAHGVPTQRASTPLLATRPQDIPGTAETIYRKQIAQQEEIIRDLQRRVSQAALTDREHQNTT